ncbi:MAG TPA: M13 family metallopeptidase [Steroidobacteraceae bacterium]|nr:M13 family metallopeptidase [Steroidobacteraceae bacterium]
MTTLTLRWAALCLVLLGAGGTTAADPSAPATGGWGFDLTGLDRSVNPGDDFFHYANGTWIKNTPVPSDRSRWGTFDRLNAKSETDLKAIVDELLAQAPPAGSDTRRVADFYRAYADTAAIERAKLDPIAAELARISTLDSHRDVARFMARPTQPYGGPIAFFPIVDPKEPGRYAIQVTQSGLGLPNRDFYLDPSASFAAIRTQYQTYIAAMLTLAKYPGAAKSAEAILALETKIAAVSWPYEKRRDYDATYHPKTRAQLVAMARDYPFYAAFNEAQLPGSFDRFIVAEDTAIAALARLFLNTPLRTWQAYLTFHCLDAYADILPQAYDEAYFEFRGHVLNGQPQKRERWKRGISAVNASIGDALGTLYVARHFSPEAKAKMTALTDNLMAAYKVRISQLAWMSPETREAALKKLASFRVMIGYPEHWKTYQDLEIRADDPVGNERRSLAHEWRRQIDRLDRPVDRSEWGLLAQEVNAENLAEFNAVIFPAAILQPPFFDPAADPAVNYGAIGGVIGHEISHSFDDQGAKLDETGRLRQWWKSEDVERFTAMGKEIIAQYDRFEPFPGVHVKGANTIGENIADLGGVSAAREAYRISLHGEDPPVLDGYTGEQRFFLGWAQAWREVIREEALRTRLVSDEHSPAQYRVNGVVRNVDGWYDAFKVPATSSLYLAESDRVRIW